MLLDTHCHLVDSAFDADRDAVIARARAVGLAGAVVVGETPEDNERILAFARAEPFALPAAGHYPSHLDEAMVERTERFIREHHAVLVAIGEVGVDHRITENPADHRRQDEILRRFAALSAEFDLPLSVHSRSAGRHAIALLAKTPARRVILHAFDARYGTAIAGLDAGFFFSVPPSIVRSRQKQKLVKNLPLDRLLLESDAPVLGPRAEERNEPANAIGSAEAIAAIHGIELGVVLDAVAENARRVFPGLGDLRDGTA